MSRESIQLNFDIDIDNATSNLSTLRRDWRDVLKELGKSPDEIKAFMQLARDAERGLVAIEDLDEETRQLLETYQSLAEVAKGREVLNLIPHAKIEEEIRKARQAYDDLRESGMLTGVELAQAHLAMEERVNELSQETNGWADAIGNVAGQLAGFAAGAVGLVAASKKAIEFESAMADVRKVVDVSDDEFAKLSDSIKRLSTELPISADGLAAIAAQAGQLGIAGNDIEAFTLLAAKMGTAFNMLPEQAGEAIAELKNVFQIPIAEVELLGNAINTLGNNTAAKEKDIVDAMTRIGGTSRQFGLVAEEAAALSAAFIALGKPPEVAATGINALLSKLQTAEVGSKSFRDGLDALGISAGQLAADVRDKPQQALIEFLQTLERLDGKSRAEILTRMFGAEYQDDISLLVGSLGDYEKALGLVTDRQATSGALDREFQERMKTTQAQLERLSNAVEVIAINLGEVFLPAIAAAAEGLITAAAAVGEFIDKFPELSAAAAVVGTIAAGAAGLRVAFSAMGVVAAKSAAAATAALRLLNTEMTATALIANKMNVAFIAAAAFLAGWEIGTYLRDEFATVRVAGVAMAEGVTLAFENMRYGWEAFQTVFNNNTLDAAAAEHEKRVQDIRDIYFDLYKDAEAVPGKLAETHAAAAEKIATIPAVVAKSIDQMLADVAASDQKIGAQIEQTQNRLAAWPILYEAVANGMGPVEEKTRLLLELGEHQKTLQVELAGLEVQRAVNTVQTLDLMNQKEQENLDKKKKLVAESGQLLDRYKIDMQQLLTGVSVDAKGAIDGLKELNAVLKAGTDEVSVQAAGMGMALTEALSSVNNGAELNALKNTWDDLGESGEITAEVWKTGLSQIKDKGEELNNSKPGKGLEEVKDGAEKSVPALKKLEDGIEEVKEKSEEFGESARVIAGGIAAIINATTQSMHGLSEAAGQAFEQMQFGKKPLDDMDLLRSKYEEARESVERLATAQAHWMNQSFGHYFAELQQNAARVTEEYYRQQIALRGLLDRLENGKSSFEELNYLAAGASKQFNLLNESDLSKLQSAIAAAKSAMDALNQSTESTLINLQNQLDSLEGKTESIENRNFVREKAELEKQYQEAIAQGNAEAARNAEESIRILEQIHRKKMQQIAIENKAERDREAESKREAERQRLTTQTPVRAASAPQNATQYAANTQKQVIELRLNSQKVELETDNPTQLLDLLARTGLTTL
jgi:TP901 family phage tail tape measure protein